jgi:hypothetical protein
MKHLVETVLGSTVAKISEDTFSNWNADELSPEQIKYALIDVDGPLRVYEELSAKHDLTQRLSLEEATVGKKVDIVPRYGSVASMATRAATGHIIDTIYCESPDGMLLTKVRAGKGMAAVKLDAVYSPSLQIPYYRKACGDFSKPILADFGNGCLELPVQMLKDHVEPDSVRSIHRQAAALVRLSLHQFLQLVI